MNKKQKTPPTGKKVPIEWHFPDGLITRFASNMLVQLLEDEFKISFFEVNPPVRMDDSEPLPQIVKADCVASLIVNANKLPKFIEVLQRQLELYQSRKIDKVT